MRPGALIDRRSAEPFRPFRRRLDDGRTSAVVVTEWAQHGDDPTARQWQTIDLARFVGPEDVAA